jgi:hypothetical protein
MQRLFEFLMFAVMVLQLELAYRQWWLEAREREARLVVDYVLRGREENTLDLSVRNIGRDFAYGVNLPFLILPQNMFARLSALFSLRPALIKRFIELLRSCAECEGGAYYDIAFIPYGASSTLGIDLSRCIKSCSHDSVVFIDICREVLPKLFSQCDAYVAVFLGEQIWYTRYNVERGPPGVLTKVPNMFSDLILMLRTSVAKH